MEYKIELTEEGLRKIIIDANIRGQKHLFLNKEYSKITAEEDYELLLRKIASNAKLFFVERYGEKALATTALLEDWVKKFNTRHPERFMSAKSLDVHNKLIEQRRYL
jgi:hypothetical protein